MILVTHAEDGSVSVRQTGDHLGRKGAGWGGGVGVAVGLFAPPMLASVAVGAVAGGVVGKFVDHRLENEIHDKIGENLPPGSAGIIAVFDDDQRLGGRAGAARLAAEVGRAERQVGRRGAEGVAGARRWASSARTARCCRSPTGTSAARSAERWTSRCADWTIVPGPKAPDGAPNVLIC